MTLLLCDGKVRHYLNAPTPKLIDDIALKTQTTHII